MLKQAFNGFRGTFTYLQPFKASIFYSTSTALEDRIREPPPMLEFLIKTVGFSEEEAASILPKVRLFSNCTTKQPELVVDFLKKSGCDNNHVKLFLTSFPAVLRYRIDKTLEPKIRALQELGFSGSNLGLILSRYPRLLSMSLETHIIPCFELLNSLIDTNEQLISLLLKAKSQKFLSTNLLKYLPHNMLLLRSYGIPEKRIKQVILEKPLALLFRAQWLEEKVKVVEEHLRIPRTSPVFMRVLTALCSISKHKLKSYFQVFRSYNWTEAEILALIRAQPRTMCLSENTLRLKLKYFKEEHGYGSDFLSSHPTLLTYSVERRIVPRTAVIQALKDKKLLKNEILLCSFICYGESYFVEKFVVNLKDELPQLYEDYMKQTLSSGASLYKFSLPKNTLV